MFEVYCMSLINGEVNCELLLKLQQFLAKEKNRTFIERKDECLSLNPTESKQRKRLPNSLAMHLKYSLLFVWGVERNICLKIFLQQ